MVFSELNGVFLQNNACYPESSHVYCDEALLIRRRVECFSTIHRMKVPVHKSWSYYTNCVMESVNHSHLKWMQMQQICTTLGWRQRQTHLLYKLSQLLSWRCLQSGTNFFQVVLSTSSACSITVQNGNCVHICKLLSHLQQVLQEMLSQFMTLLVATELNTYRIPHSTFRWLMEM